MQGQSVNQCVQPFSFHVPIQVFFQYSLLIQKFDHLVYAQINIIVQPVILLIRIFQMKNKSEPYLHLSHGTVI
ncbi:hypothetical protein D3C73_1443080 [compost metagenome]